MSPHPAELDSSFKITKRLAQKYEQKELAAAN
jgi:hypothetical protein